MMATNRGGGGGVGGSHHRAVGMMDDSEVDPSVSTHTDVDMLHTPSTSAAAAAATASEKLLQQQLPASMADALDWGDPEAALRALSAASAVQAQALAKKLLLDLESNKNDNTTQTTSSNILFSRSMTQLPDLLYLDRQTKNNYNNNKDHYVHNAMACADSILQSLTKIAVGGSQASAEIRKLEEEKLQYDYEAQAVEQAILLRKASNQAAAALQEQQNVQVRLLVRQNNNSTNTNNNSDPTNSSSSNNNNNNNLQQQGSGPNYAGAANALAIWLEWKDKNTTTMATTMTMQQVEIAERARQYAGEYSLEQLQRTYRTVKTRLLEQYEQAVQNGNLGAVGQLTPILAKMQLEPKAVALYMQFLSGVLETNLAQAAANAGNDDNNNNTTTSKPPYVAMGRSYNAAVTVLRHHLPLVSHCLHKANGDVAVVQLVHAQCTNTVVPLWQAYQRDKQLVLVSNHAARIARILEERYYNGHHHHHHQSSSIHSHLASTSRRLLDGTTDALLSAGSSSGGGGNDAEFYDDEDADDAGFATQIGSLSDVDAAMEEVALCLQHAESYLRFIQHTCHEVNKARQIRHEQAAQQARLERERAEWAAGRRTSSDSRDGADAGGGGGENNNDEDKPYQVMEILPPFTRLHQTVAEVGGQYVSIERCLLLASMQRAFVASPETDARYYRPLSSLNKGTGGSASAGGGGGMGGGSGHEALQTALVDTCLYAARRSTQRAFATGHTGTASAMTNFCVDALTAVLLEVLRQRAEDSGVAMLKPGEGLLISSIGGGLAGSAIFNSAASHLIRQGAGNVGVGVSNVMTGGTTPQQKLGGSNTVKDELVRKHKQQLKVAQACAVMNDLEVAVFHTEQLESVLTEAITKGFPSGTHDTEQLLMCVKSLSNVTESMRLASDATIDSLDSVLKPRIRSIVGEAVGSEGSSSSAASTSAFMVSPVIGGKASDRNAHVRMNYNLDEEAYNMLQLSEGYIARLCTLLDELMDPLRIHLAPRLWDILWLNTIGTAAKRLETLLLRKCSFTALGALALDSDMRDWVTYTRERLSSQSAECAVSNLAVMRACPPLGRLVQIAKLLNVDDLEDVLDFISAMKRKGHDWDLKLEDAKAFLSQRVEFDSDKIHELLRIPEGE